MSNGILDGLSDVYGLSDEGICGYDCIYRMYVNILASHLFRAVKIWGKSFVLLPSKCSCDDDDPEFGNRVNLLFNDPPIEISGHNKDTNKKFSLSSVCPSVR